MNQMADNGWTALLGAASWGSSDVVRALLDAGEQNYVNYTDI